MGQQKPHAIMIPFPLQGHINPFIDLAVHLASNGVAITFVNTHFNHHLLTQSNGGGDRDIFAGARDSGLDIRYATVSDGFPIGFDRFNNLDQAGYGLVHMLCAHVDELVGNIVRSADDAPPLTVLIADTFYVWPSVIAKKHNLVHVSFWTQPAVVFDICYHLDLLKINGHFGSIDNREDEIDYIPGVGSFSPKDLMSFLQDKDTSSRKHQSLFSGFDDVKLADFILCNTIQELEPEPISALHKIQPFYAIGSNFQNGPNKPIGPTSLRPKSHCTNWLDSKPPGSVLYVSFGSYVSVRRDEFLEIAYGLLGCDAGFIWVLRADSVGYGEDSSLPVGLEEGLRMKGLIVPWCSQADVIAHRAVGGFLTHCGWNSVLESVRCGVPMLCYPLYADQMTNRKLVVDDWRAGINLCDEKPIRREEVRDNIDRLMSQKSTNEWRQNVEKVRVTMEQAVGPNGSATINLNEFIKAVKSKIKLNGSEPMKPI